MNFMTIGPDPASDPDPTLGPATPYVSLFGGEMAPVWTNSRALFDGRQELFIEHASQVYRLRITRQNKLILTK
jgi:hypothetical protein